jgi:hypothetical protein
VKKAFFGGRGQQQTFKGKLHPDAKCCFIFSVVINAQSAVVIYFGKAKGRNLSITIQMGSFSYSFFLRLLSVVLLHV